MNSISAYHTDVGTYKTTNQDSISLMVADTVIGEVVLAVICDGMGGLQKGELASATVTSAFKDWFEKDFPQVILEADLIERVFQTWKDIFVSQNQIIAEYGTKNRIVLGTTATVILILGSKKYLIGHVGDSRVYILNQSAKQLTEDHTVINEEIKRGKLTLEQAKTDVRRNVLLQCVGASPKVVPDLFNGNCSAGDVFLLCSDGFRHEVSLDEIAERINSAEKKDEDVMKQALVDLVELNKERGERDNISAVTILIQ